MTSSHGGCFISCAQHLYDTGCPPSLTFSSMRLLRHFLPPIWPRLLCSPAVKPFPSMECWPVDTFSPLLFCLAILRNVFRLRPQRYVYVQDFVIWAPFKFMGYWATGLLHMLSEKLNW